MEIVGKLGVSHGGTSVSPTGTDNVNSDWRSKEGWGGHLGDWVVSGQLPTPGAKHHKLAGVPGSVVDHEAVLPQLSGAAVDILSDNSITVAHINKEDGTQFPSKARRESTCQTDNSCLKHYRLWCVDRSVSLSGHPNRGGKSPKCPQKIAA